MSNQEIMKYSVIVPVFNSKSSLKELYLRISGLFSASGTGFEVIFVDDSSHDGSWQVISELKRENPGLITAVALSRNFGQHNATLCGIHFATGDFIITIDDDLQTPPEEIEKLIKTRQEEQFDLVYGVYGKKRHSLARNVGSSSLRTGARVLHDSPGKGSSFRLMTRELATSVLRHQQHFIFLDEILLWYTRHIGYADVNHQPRPYDQSGYSLAKLVRLFTNLIFYYTMVPLKFLVYGGLFISLITFVYGLFFIFKKLVFDVPLGYTSLIVTILFSTSIILFSLGVLGEYLSRIYQLQNNKPPWSVKMVMTAGNGLNEQERKEEL